MSHRLWIIGGTEESRLLVEALLAHSRKTAQPPLSLLISVTTDVAKQLYPLSSSVTIWVGRLTFDDADAFLKAHNIGSILDTSHPFAVQISQLAIALSERYRLPYLRYERPHADTVPANWCDATGRPGNLLLSQLADVFKGGYLVQERTLLTLGYRGLADFAAWQSYGKLFVRVLPSQAALAAALTAGFAPERIIALRPPISDALERALWQQWQITQVVTKASGKAGGEDRKQAIAAELGVRLIRIARPVIAYPAQTDCLETAIQFGLAATLPLEP